MTGIGIHTASRFRVATTAHGGRRAVETMWKLIVENRPQLTLRFTNHTLSASRPTASATKIAVSIPWNAQYRVPGWYTDLRWIPMCCAQAAVASLSGKLTGLGIRPGQRAL